MLMAVGVIILTIREEYFNLIILTLLAFNTYFKAVEMNQNSTNNFHPVIFLKKTPLNQIKSLFSFLHSINTFKFKNNSILMMKLFSSE